MTRATPLNIRYRKPLTTVESLRYAIEAAVSASAPQRVEVLPPGMKLVADLKLGKGTVFDAYRLLGEANLVDADGRAGTVINPAWEDRADVTAAADDLARLAHGNGVELHYLLALLAQLWPEPPEVERNVAEKARIETEGNAADEQLLFEDDPSASLAEWHDYDDFS